MKKKIVTALGLAVMVSGTVIGSAEASFKDDVLNFPTVTGTTTTPTTTTTTTTSTSGTGVNLFDTTESTTTSTSGVNLFDTTEGSEVNLFDSSETTSEEVNLFDSSETSTNSNNGGGSSGGGSGSSGGSSGGNSRVYQCNDGVDNDGDGKIDYPADKGCSTSYDNTENTDATVTGGTTQSPTAEFGGVSTTEMACSDGIDNDRDGLTDFPADPDCLYKMDPSEGEMAAVQEHTAAPRPEAKTGNTQSGPAENMLVAGLASLAAVYLKRKKNLAGEK